MVTKKGTFMNKIILILLMLSSAAFGKEFSITIDDPNLYSKPLFSSVDRDLKILDQLDRLNAKAALFVCGKRVDSDEGKDLLKRWDERGHLMANHTYSHYYYNGSQVSYENYSKDILKVEPLITGLNNFERYFRFPFLKSGNTKEKRDRIRNFLKSNNYNYGYVTIDASDWYISDRMVKKLSQNPQVDLEGYKKYYLDHMWERAQYYDKLSKQVLGRSVKHTILIHHNLLNALFLEDLINHFKSKGWKLIDPRVAFKDPVYKEAPNTLPSGESIVWALAKEKDISTLRYPAEDGRYEEERMDKLGL